MEVVIIDYNAGNIRSVENALKRLNGEPVITADKQLIRHADKVIFPGVGEAATTMSFLQERGLDVLIKSLTQPVLGICLGMQLMCRYSEEGATNCLGIFDTEVKRFELFSSGENIRKFFASALSLKISRMYFARLAVSWLSFAPCCSISNPYFLKSGSLKSLSSLPPFA